MFYYVILALSFVVGAALNTRRLLNRQKKRLDLRHAEELVSTSLAVVKIGHEVGFEEGWRTARDKKFLGKDAALALATHKFSEYVSLKKLDLKNISSTD